MKSNALTLKTILLGTIISLSISMYGSAPALFTSPELPAFPQIKLGEDSSNDDGDDDDDAPSIVSGGIISEDQIICGTGIPELIENVSAPSGEVEGFLVFQWERMVEGEGWVVIPGENGLEYEPISISSTTLYRRGCREYIHQPWFYSNTVTKKVVAKIENVQLSASPVTCKGGSDGSVQAAVAGGTPGYMFDWIVSDETSNELTDMPAGFYNVEVTDQNGSTYTSVFIEVTEPDLGISIHEVFSFEPTCAGGANGGIFMNAFDGVEPYEYNWSNGAVGPVVLEIPAGSYDITVTDALGCAVTESDIVLSEPDKVILHDQAVPATCHNAMDGSIILTAVGGTSPYLYVWPDGTNGDMRDELAAGNYSVVIFDANGCQFTEEVTIAQPEELEIAPYIVNNKVCKASVNVVPSGGTAPYSYEWEDGSIEGFKTGLCPGFYTVDVTDNYGCKSTETLEIVTETAKEDITIAVIVNPFYKEGNVIIKLPFDDHADVRIYSPTGQLIEVFMHEVAEDNQEIKLSLDLDKYSNGVYILDVKSGGLTSSAKVIISN